MSTHISDEITEHYINLLKTKGEEGLYKQAIAVGVKISPDVNRPEEEILNISDAFFVKFRQSDDENYFVVGRVLRRAAHTLYRQFLRINKGRRKNRRFLNIVK